MASVNRVILVGNLGRDPEVRFTPGGQAVCNFSIATSESWTDKTTGTKQEKTEWHRIQCWGRLAEICGEHLKKGKSVYIEGKLTTREWEKDGVKRQSTEVVASEVKFLGGKDAGGQQEQQRPAQQSGGYQQNAQAQQQTQRATQAVNDVFGAPGQDDIPFMRWDLP